MHLVGTEAGNAVCMMHFERLSCIGRVTSAHRSYELCSKQAADNEADELSKEQSDVPEEEFKKQPAAGGPLVEGAQAAWDAAAQVAGKAKSLVRGQGE